MSVYTLAEQMGTSVKMIEQHYGHNTPALKAQEIAGKRHVPRVAAVDAVAATPQLKNTAKLKVVK